MCLSSQALGNLLFGKSAIQVALRGVLAYALFRFLARAK
jgi:hypothetical protein